MKDVIDFEQINFEIKTTENRVFDRNLHIGADFRPAIISARIKIFDEVKSSR